MSDQTDREARYAEALHEANLWQYDHCDHGTYSGGPRQGEPYAMCQIMAPRLARVEQERLRAVEALVNDWPCSDETCDGDCTGCAYASELRAALASPVESDTKEVDS